MIMSTILFFFFYFVVLGVKSDLVCGDISKPGSSLQLDINSRKIETGDWVTAFSVRKDSKIPSDNINLKVDHKVIDCEGRQIVKMYGVVNEGLFEYDNRELLFHPNCGINAAISDDGRSAEKINPEDAYNGVVLTNRPLKNEELFEVRIDKINTKFSRVFGIGVTSHSPDTLNVPNHMWNLKSQNWMYYNNDFSIDGNVSLKVYGRNLNQLREGDRVGVLRNKFGTLRFFINGVDQGPAASKVPYPVYGVFELYFDVLKGTIVNSSKSSSA